MKKAILCLLIFTSCKNGVSNKDKAHIQTQIVLHNSSVGLRLQGNDDLDTTVASDKYRPNLDPFLSYEKLVRYCSSRNKDILREADVLTIK